MADTLMTEQQTTVMTGCETLADVLIEAQKAFPERKALTADGVTSTFDALANDARAFASGLVANGVTPDTRVAIWAPNTRDWIIGYYGASMTGAAIVPIDAMSTAEEVIYILGDSGASCLICGSDNANALADIRAEVALDLVVLTADAPKADGSIDMAALVAQGDVAFTPPNIDRETLSTIGYTSGSTGKPKGAMLSHWTVILSARLTADVHGRTEDDVFISSLPCTHVYGNAIIHACFMVGGRLFMMRRFDSDQVLDAIERERATMFEGVPTMYFNLLAHPRLPEVDTSSLRRITVGGQSIPVETIQAAEKALGCPMLELWGMTELGGPATAHRFGEAAAHGSIGKALSPMESKLDPLDAPGGSAPWDGETVGELCIKGPLVMQGYLGNPDATADAIDADGWLHTGDLATISPEGHIFISGRKKEIILTAGYTIFPPEIEAVLAQHPAVQLAVVGKVPDEQRGELAIAYVVVKPGHQVLAGELEAFARRHLAAYKAPRQVIFVEDVPKTGSGKIKRHELAQLAKPVSAHNAYTPRPGNPPSLLPMPYEPDGAPSDFVYVKTDVVEVQNEDRAAGKVGIVTLAGPKGINALNETFISEIVTALHRFDQDPEVRCMILKGITTDVFSVGADIAEMADRTFSQAYEADFFSTGWAKIAECRKPLIGAIGGLALGGGCEISLMCDILIAAENAEFGLPEVRLGIFPGAGGTQRLARQVGKSKAMEIILTGQINLTADEALSADLVSRVVPTDQLMNEALTLAGQIASNSTMTVRMAKEAVNRVYESSLADGLMYERRLFYSSLATADKAEGTRAFVEKRLPRFTDS